MIKLFLIDQQSGDNLVRIVAVEKVPKLEKQSESEALYQQQ